jgi:hypothetical protein
MERINKSFSLLIVVILAVSSLSLIVVESANASISKPSVPEFTVKYVDRSYDTQPTYGTDQYTGKTVITKPSEHVDNRTVEITINNQPFTAFTDTSSGRDINLFYNVRYKGSFGQEWTSMFGERAETAGVYDPYGTYGFPMQGYSSQYTTIIYSLPWNVVDGQMGIQVEALEGYTNRTVDPSREHIIWSVYEYTFYGEESGWSNTQTVTLSENSTSPTPTVPEFPQSAILPLVVIIPLIVTAHLRKKHRSKGL